MESNLMLIALNLAVTTMGGYVTICRLAKMSQKTTKLAIRWQYVIWFCVFTASGWSFLFAQPADWMQVAMGLSIVVHLLLGTPAWRGTTPMYARRDFLETRTIQAAEMSFVERRFQARR